MLSLATEPARAAPVSGQPAPPPPPKKKVLRNTEQEVFKIHNNNKMLTESLWGRKEAPSANTWFENADGRSVQRQAAKRRRKKKKEKKNDSQHCSAHTLSTSLTHSHSRRRLPLSLTRIENAPALHIAQNLITSLRAGKGGKSAGFAVLPVLAEACQVRAKKVLQRWWHTRYIVQ